MNGETVGRRMRSTREKLGLTQQAVAEYLGVTREAVSNYETGQRQISLAALHKVSSLFGYSPAYFIDESATEVAPDMAFRTAGLGDEDLESVAWAKRFLQNMVSLRSKLGE